MLLPTIHILSNLKFRYSILSILILFSSHFQIYNHNISNGWDCTLAHFPNFEMRYQLSKFLTTIPIGKEMIATKFPLIASEEQMYWYGENTKYAEIHDINTHQYILYSNISNDFSKDEIEVLNNFKIIWSEKSSFCEMILYKNPKIENVQQ